MSAFTKSTSYSILLAIPIAIVLYILFEAQLHQNYEAKKQSIRKNAQEQIIQAFTVFDSIQDEYHIDDKKQEEYVRFLQPFQQALVSSTNCTDCRSSQLIHRLRPLSAPEIFSLHEDIFTINSFAVSVEKQLKPLMNNPSNIDKKNIPVGISDRIAEFEKLKQEVDSSFNFKIGIQSYMLPVVFLMLILTIWFSLTGRKNARKY